MSEKTVLVFDLDDTLYDLAQPQFQAMRKVFGNRLKDLSNEQFTAFRKYSDERFEESQDGRISMEEMYIYRIRMTMRELGIEITEEEALSFQKEYIEAQSEISLSKQMKELLSECLQQDIFLAVISNGKVPHQMNKITALHLTDYIPSSRIFISGALPYAKPDPEIFRLVAGKLGEELQGGVDTSNQVAQRDDASNQVTRRDDLNFVYVGDSYENDVVAPKAAGWQCIWYNHRGYDEKREEKANQIVHTEKELCDTIRKLLSK